MSYNAAVIGCGMMGSEYSDDALISEHYSHAGAFVSCPSTNLVALCDSSEEKVTKSGHKWGVKACYTDVNSLFENHSIDMVSVCTSNQSHAEILRYILLNTNVKAVLMEKPIALDVSEADELVQLAKEKQIILSVNYSRRYSKGLNLLKTKLKAKEFGEVQSVSGIYTKGIQHNGTHWIDLARWLIGDILQVKGVKTSEKLENDPCLNAIFYFEHDLIGFLQGVDANLYSVFEMDILSTSGRIQILDSGHKICFHTVHDSPYYSGYKTIIKSDEINGGLNDATLNLVEDAIHCIEHQTEPKCTGQDGIQAIKIANELIDSIKSPEVV